MSKKAKGKRLYLINRDFQLRYTKIAVLVGFSSTVLTVMVILFPLFQLNILRFPNFVPFPFIIAMAVAALLNFLIVAFMGVLLTHRIAGPMFSLVRHIRMIQMGKIRPPLRVRDGDDLKYLVRNFNELVEHLREVTVSDRDKAGAIVEALSREPGPDVASARRLAEELRDLLAGRMPSDEPLAAGQTGSAS